MKLILLKRSVLSTVVSPEQTAAMISDCDGDLANIEWEYYSQWNGTHYIHHIIAASDETNSELLGVEPGRIVCLNRVIMSRMLDQHYDALQNVTTTYRNGADFFLVRHNMEFGGHHA
jgi:hypothetical protein